MSSNRIVAALLVALLAGPIFLSGAAAQTTTANVIVAAIDVGSPRVVGLPALVNVTIRNIGGQTFNPGAWQIFIGLNGRDNSACITGAGTFNPTNPTNTVFPPCYIRMGLGGSTSPSIAANGGERTFSITWNATPAQVRDTNLIYAEILNINEQPGSPGADDQCPDTPNCDDNSLERGIRIDRVGVRANALREARPIARSSVNDPWPADTIPDTEACPSGTGANPQPVTKGCRVAPGTLVVTDFQVNNTGTIEETFVPQLLSPAVSEEFLRRGYTFGFGPEVVRIAPNATAKVRLSIFVPLNETPSVGINTGATANLSVRWASRLLPSVTTNAGSANETNPGCTSENPCADPTLPTLRVTSRHQFNITTNWTWDETSPGEASEFRLNLTNLGNVEDRYNVSFVPNAHNMPGWNLSITSVPQLTPDAGDAVQPGEDLSVRLFATPPSGAQRPLNGTYWFDVAVKSRGDQLSRATCKHWDGTFGPQDVRTNGTGPTCTVRFYVHLRQEWNISGTGSLPRREVPGKTVTYDLTLRNEGNGWDNFTLNLAAAQPNWDARLSTTSVSLAPGNSTVVQLIVTSPATQPENTQNAFYVNATSSGPPDRSDRSQVSIMSLYTIARGPNIRLDAPTNKSFVDAGTSIEFTITATNIGNVADNFTIPLPDRPSDWGIERDPQSREVQPGESFPIRVRLTAPTTALTGEAATATVHVRSTVDRSLDSSLFLEGSISGPDLFVDNVLVNATTPYSGDPLEVTVALGNAGNKAADRNSTLRLFFVQGGVERLIGEKQYAAGAIAAQRRLTETFVWDTAGIEGAGVLLARVDVANNVREMDESVASNEGALSLTLRRFALRLDPAQPLTARPGELLAYSEPPNAFTLTYTGDDPAGEPVLIRVESAHGWLTSNAEFAATVLPGAPLLIQPRLEVPRLPGTARDELTVTVEPTRRPLEAKRASVTTTLIDEEKPIIRGISVSPPTADLGTPVLIRVDLEDATGITSVTAYVTAPTNQTSAHPLTQTADGRWVLNGTFLTPGAYRVTAEASDAADPPNRNTTRAVTGSFSMNPGVGPSIRLAAGQATTIRTGANVRMAITDPAGVAKASYTIRGVSYDLRAPDFLVDTSTFPAGSVEINVTAENIHGVRSTEAFRLTVDNDVPTITKVTLEPERPRTGDAVKVTIATQSEVQGVTVALKKDGNLVKTLNATRRTAGTFEVTFDAEEGDYRLDVTANDVAGNSGVAGDAVVFSARPGSPVPFPAWVGLLALLGVAVLLSRRSKRD